MGLKDLIDSARSDTYYHKDAFVEEIVKEYYPKALEEAEGDLEEAAAIAVDNFYRDIAYGRAANMWESYAIRGEKAAEFLQDPTVLEFNLDNLEEPVHNIKDAVVKVVGYLVHEKLWWDTQKLESAVLEAVTTR